MNEQLQGNRNAVTETEFCHSVGISRTSAWRLRKAKQLPFCRIGAKILYTPEHVKPFLAIHEQGLESNLKKGVRNK